LGDLSSRSTRDQRGRAAVEIANSVRGVDAVEDDAAFEAVSRLDGIGGITNKIKVVTAGGW
jgi:hypothetical protein